jgi:3-methyl-2-oxobutanoate hydroxymethyltransferase
MTPAKVTVPFIRGSKNNGPKVVCVTAYDCPSAEICDEAGVDIVLVGDSVGNTVLGYENTLPVSMDDMIHHTRAVRRGLRRALLVADLPFGSYQQSVEEAVRNSVELIKAGAEAVKLEGNHPETIRRLVHAGIPVMGHVGFTPQSVHIFGGYKRQKQEKEGQRIVEEARSIEEAGAFSIVLELMEASLAGEITKAVGVPTIGIGAGNETDGQVQVWHDLLGITREPPGHAMQMLNAREQMLRAVRTYAAKVRPEPVT